MVLVECRVYTSLGFFLLSVVRMTAGLQPQEKISWYI
jgi:hypothetical protein